MLLRKVQFAAIAAAALVCLSAPSFAQDATAKKIVYHVSGGTFATNPTGADQLQLAGNPFQLSVIASASTKPTKHGKAWALYSNMEMQGSVTSTARPGQPFAVHSKHAVLFMSVSNAAYDEFKLTFPYTVSGTNILFVADLHLPKHTLAGFLIKPFNNSVDLSTLSPAATVTYSSGSASTVLSISGGTFTGTAGAPPAVVKP